MIMLDPTSDLLLDIDGERYIKWLKDNRHVELNILAITAALGWNRIALAMGLFPNQDQIGHLPELEQNLAKLDYNRFIQVENKLKPTTKIVVSFSSL